MSDGVLIAARMGSSRYPGKVMAPLCGKPVIDHVIDRALDVFDVHQVMVATSVDKSDDPLAQYVEKRCAVYRGSTGNVLHRLVCASKVMGASWVCRITGDCPLIDPRVMQEIIERPRAGLHYIGRSNSPDGTDVELVSVEALDLAYRNCTDNEVEHPLTWIRKHLPCESQESDPAYRDVHYSVDSVEQLKICEKMLQACGPGARWEDHVQTFRRICGRHSQAVA